LGALGTVRHILVLATLHDAIPLLLFGAGGLLAIGLVDYGLYRFGRKHDGPPRLLFWLAGVVLTVFAGGFAALTLLLGVALAGCAPDAYECPL
jgi:hypothetical protein